MYNYMRTRYQFAVMQRKHNVRNSTFVIESVSACIQTETKQENRNTAIEIHKYVFIILFSTFNVLDLVRRQTYFANKARTDALKKTRFHFGQTEMANSFRNATQTRRISQLNYS